MPIPSNQESVFTNDTYATRSQWRGRFGLVRSKRLVWFVIAIIFISLVAVVLVTTLLLWQSTDASSVAPDQRSITSTSTEAFVQATNTTETTIIRKKIVDQCSIYSLLASFNESYLSPDRMLITDFDSDGRLDIIVSLKSYNEVHGWFNLGNGTLINRKLYSSDSDINYITSADMNNDYQDDLIMSIGKVIYIIFVYNLNNSLYTVEKIILSTTGFRTFVILDINMDHILDIVTSEHEVQYCTSFLNDGNGTFIAQTFNISGFPEANLIAIHNKNDQMVNILVRSYQSSAMMLMNNGNGTFTQHITNINGDIDHPIVLSDLNNDNKTDILMIDQGIKIYFNLGNNMFDDPIFYPWENITDNLDIADVNNDHQLDIIVTNLYENRIEVYFNTGHKTFSNTQQFSDITRPIQATAFDIDGDNQNEMIILNSTAIYLSRNHC